MRPWLVVTAIGCLTALAGDTPADPWKEDKKLQRKMTFEFTDTPLTEAVKFLSNLCKVNFVFDPGADADRVAVSKEVSDLPLKEALTQMLDDAGLDIEPLDEALFIFKKGVYRKPSEGPPKPLTAEQADAFKQAIREMASEEFATREAASKKIAALGRDAQPLLEETLKESKDAEVRRRVQAALSPFQARSFATDPPEVAKALDAFGKKVTFEFVQTPLADAVVFMDKLLDAKITVDKAVAESSVSLRVKDMTAANALRWIARLGNVRLAVQAGELTLVKPDEKAK
jgi:type II secretory pathway component GspD/PulD (secretin)